MSTAEEVGTTESFLSSRERRNPITLPTDPSDEELARNWTLSEGDKAEVILCRGEEHRRRFALQLCVLRRHGRFLTEISSAPVRIINHLGYQLGLPPALFMDPPSRESTEREHQKRIRDYLGFRSFDPDTEERLRNRISSRAAEGLLSPDLFHYAEDLLLSWRVVLPGPSTLERIVASVSRGAREQVFEQILGRLSPKICTAIDELLQVPEGDRRSPLFRLKEYPPEATAAAITAYIDRYDLLLSVGVDQVDLTGVATAQVLHFAKLARHYDARALKRFALTKRHAMVACFLVETQKSLLDHIVAMHDQFVTTMARRSRRTFEERHRELRKSAKKGLDTLLDAVEILLGAEYPGENVLDTLYRSIPTDRLREARESCREFQHLQESGYLKALCARYSQFRRYIPRFFSLPFEGEAGAEPILNGLSLVRSLDAGECKKLPSDAPTEFVPSAWRSALRREDGTVDHRVWEIALYQAVRWS